MVVRELATRNVSSNISGPAIALGTGVVITTMAGIVSLFTGWEAPGRTALILLAAAACFLSLGYVSSVNAVRTGDISFTASFRYSVLLFAIALQIIVFGDIPDVFTFVGSAIVGAAGLYALANESASTRRDRRSLAPTQNTARP